MIDYYVIDVLAVSQISGGSGGIFTGRVSFEQLLTIYRLTERKESTTDPFGEKKVDYEKLEAEEFQRHLSNTKLAEIRNYLRQEFSSEKKSAVFPSSLILSLDINEENSEDFTEEQIIKLQNVDSERCFLIKSNCGNSFRKILIPKTKRICLIVDGQHRFYGLKKFLEETTPVSVRQDQISKFEFITTILLGFDPYQVAEVFANVNFNQKPVNRSLYYDIFGSSATDRNEIQLAHFLVLHLQNNQLSPLKGMIKLLGKGYGLFSQAFFVEKVLPHLNEKGVFFSLFKDFQNNGSKFYHLPEYLKAYFNSIKSSYSTCWPELQSRDGELVYTPFGYEYIVCKTTGMGAFLRLIKDIFPKTNGLLGQELQIALNNIFSKISEDEAKSLFHRQGEYGGAGSEGLQVKLYRYLKTRLEV